MSAFRTTLQILSLLGAGAALGGCWDDDPCDPGQVFEDGVCRAAPPSEPPPQGGEAGAPGVEPGPETSPWDSPCTSEADCAGDAVFCPPSPFNTCTNINCSPGEENEGICPADWTCIPAGGGLPTSICAPPM